MDTSSSYRSDSPPFFWQSACLKKIDPRMFLFCSQFIISIMIRSFCIMKLWKTDSCEAQSLYGNMVITIIGLWMPSPLQKTK